LLLLKTHSRLLAVLLFITVLQSGCTPKKAVSIGQKEEVAFSQSSSNIERYDFVEVTINVAKPAAKNPFTDVTVSAHFGQPGQKKDVKVEGFCDSGDGSVFRVRFMPSAAGDYNYSVTYRRDDFEGIHDGSFRVVEGKRSGILRTDSHYPWHFIWEGSAKHFFFNGTTAFLMMGWDNEQVIRDSVARLSGLGINRIRLLLDGRTDHFWTEPIIPGNGFRAYLNPWTAKRPDDVIDPGFDYAQFNCPYWQKFERMLFHARENEVIVSVIFGWNDTKVHPGSGSEDERRYFRYAVARLSAFSNVTWDLGDDLDGFRSPRWTHDTGTMLYQLDPYHHLATSHPIHNEHQDRTSEWFAMTSFQQWDRPLHEWMLSQRQQQAKTGRIIPQTNEEYGYEDHYPAWAPYKSPAASADADRRAAWEISMAGCYQTTGETAKRGTGVPPDTGGGWVNGRGDNTMVMLKGYANLVNFFTTFEWWKADPHDELVNNGAFCLAEPAKVYAIYLPHGGVSSIKLEPGRYEAKWFNPRDGLYANVGIAEGSEWNSPPAPDQEDWILLLTRGQVAQ
jgi:hypothetical protein